METNNYFHYSIDYRIIIRINRENNLLSMRNNYADEIFLYNEFTRSIILNEYLFENIRILPNSATEAQS